MWHTLHKYWKIFWRFRLLSFMQLLEYRGNFFFWSTVSLMWTVFNIFFFAVITRVSGNIGGWTLPEMFLLLGVFTIFDTMTWSFFWHNMTEYSRAVFSGKLNEQLVRPVDTQILLMVAHGSYTSVFRFFAGLYIIVKALHDLQLHPSVGQILGFAATLLLAFTFVYFLWFILSTLSFWVEKLDNINEIIPTFRRVWQVPRTIYQGIASTIFTVLLPLGLVTSLPSEILLGRPNWSLIGYLAVFTLGTVIVSRLFFRWSIIKYVGMAN